MLVRFCPSSYRTRDALELIGDLVDHVASCSLFLADEENILELVQQGSRTRKLSPYGTRLQGRLASETPVLPSFNHRVAPCGAAQEASRRIVRT